MLLNKIKDYNLIMINTLKTYFVMWKQTQILIIMCATSR